MQFIKIVVIGDDTVGKTCLLIVETSGQFPIESVPSVFDSYSPGVVDPSNPIQLGFWDTLGSNVYDKLRPLSYPGTDCVVLCFSVVDPASYENVRSKWKPELQNHDVAAPLLLIGTKIDLREDQDTLSRLAKDSMSPITYEQGVSMANEIGAIKYMECSALRKIGVENIFDEAIRVCLDNHAVNSKKKQDRCIMM